MTLGGMTGADQLFERAEVGRQPFTELSSRFGPGIGSGRHHPSQYGIFQKQITKARALHLLDEAAVPVDARSRSVPNEELKQSVPCWTEFRERFLECLAGHPREIHQQSALELAIDDVAEEIQGIRGRGAIPPQ